MSRELFAAIVVIVIVLIFIGMWRGWRARSRQDAFVHEATSEPGGTVIAEFQGAYYVSTTPVGEPLVRVAIPGLKYRGRAQVTVREQGVTVQVDGEDAVHFSVPQLSGSGTAGRRVGKAVENGGLALMLWDAEDGRELESSFRFESRDEQTRFTEAIDRITPPIIYNIESTY